MHSSTSSSETEHFQRPVPESGWPMHLVVAVALTVCVLGLWELQVRSQGYLVTHNDTPKLWIKSRAAAVDAGPSQFVFLGTSRTLFDIDLQLFADMAQVPFPIQLGALGSNPIPVLEDLADDSSFAGTVLVGFTPAIISDGAPHVFHAIEYNLELYHKDAPSDASELFLAQTLSARLAFINQDELDLGALLRDEIPWPARPGVFRPVWPGHIHTIDARRQARLHPFVVAPGPRQTHAREVWMTYLKVAPEGERPPDFFETKAREWTQNIERTKLAIAKISRRGGQVFFHRPPSSGDLRERERELFPRDLHWERLLLETGRPGFHFEDYPDTRELDCPEWSHLETSGARRYTAALVERLNDHHAFPTDLEAMQYLRVAP